MGGQEGLNLQYSDAMKDLDKNLGPIDNIIKGRHDLTNIRTLHGLATGFSMTTAEFLNFAEMNEAQFKGK